MEKLLTDAYLNGSHHRMNLEECTAYERIQPLTPAVKPHLGYGVDLLKFHYFPSPPVDFDTNVQMMSHANFVDSVRV